MNSPQKNLSGMISWMAHNPVAANLLMVTFIVGGFLMLKMRVRQEVFPQIEPDYINITVPYPGASPEEVEQGILLAIEEAVRPLDGIKEINSSASEGAGSVSIELDIGVDKNKTLADVKSAVDRIVTFPQDAERPIVMAPKWRAEAISIVIYGDQKEKILREFAETMRDELLDLPEISYVELFGTKSMEISVEVPQDTLRQYGLTLGQIASKVRQTALEIPAGGVKTPAGEVLLRTAERRDLGREFMDIAVAHSTDGVPVKLGDIADIKDGFAETDLEAAYDGQRSIEIEVYSVGDESPTVVAETAKRYVEKKRQMLPEGVNITTWRDRSEIYRDRLDLLLKNAAIGLVLVLVILGLFLEPRLAFWVTMGIPISFFGSFFFLPMFNVSLNMISLFAFIITLGMVVDDAIVVGENAFRFRRKGMQFLEAAVRGARQVSMPVFFSVATTVVAFAPGLFIPGTRGKFMMNIPLVVILVMSISLIESFFILPAHISHLGTGAWLKFLTERQKKFSMGVEKFIRKVYAPFLNFAMRNRWITVSVGIAVLVSSCGLIKGGHVKMTDFPKEESDWVSVEAKLPFGVSIDETGDVMQRLIATAKETINENGGPQINRGIFSILGASRGGAGSHVTMVIVNLVPTDFRPIGSYDFSQKWRKKIGQIPGIESLTFDFTTGHGGSLPIDVQLSHSRTDTLEAAAADLARQLASFDGVKDVDDGIELGKPQWDFTLSPEGVAAGLTSADLASQVRSSFYGSEALRQQRGRNEIRVFVRLPREERESLTNVEDMIIRTPDGGEMPLMAAAEVKEGRAYTSIRRTNGKRTIRVMADVDEDRANAQEVMAALYSDVLPDLRLKYPGLGYGRAGRQKSMQEFMDFLFKLAYPLALIVMYVLIAIPLRSYLQPFFVVMIAIPFGAVGAIVGHLIMGYMMSLISFMGFVALSGVVVNDSLVFVAAANRIRQERGFSGFDAAYEAGQQRFRAIVLTSLTTFAGLTPMIFETSVQARVLIPMAISLGFGVLFATLVTLVIVPCLFVLIENLRDWRSLHFSNMRAEDAGGEST